MKRTRVKLAVYVDLDPIPGAMHTADSARDVVSGALTSLIGHYNPEVQIENFDLHGSIPAATDAACE